MKISKILLLLFILVLAASSVSATNETIVDDIDNSPENGIIYVSGNHTESNVAIGKSITIEGQNNACFDGLGKNSLFTIENESQVTFKNINFANFYKTSNGAVLDIKKSSSVIIQNCTFINNTMAINNQGNLSIYNSYFYNSKLIDNYSAGGAIYSQGVIYIENTSIFESIGYYKSNGAAIYNNGDLTLINSRIANSYAYEDSKGSAIYNNGKSYLYNSIIENNIIERGNFNYMYGVIFNQGDLTANSCIFRNNTGKYVKPNTWYEGSPNIYNVGNLNLSYNAFIDNVYFKGLSIDIFNNGAKSVNIDNNWWNSNENPLNEYKINQGNNISSWIILDLSPQYSALNINESAQIKASWMSSSGEKLEGIFSKFNITFKTIFDSEKTYENNIFTFNHTQTKGSYDITVRVESFKTVATVDVGKNPVYINFKVKDNITYPESLFLEVFTNLNNEDIIVNLNDKKYLIKLNSSYGNITLDKLMPGSYDLKMTYEGSENQFKAFNSTRITINKMPVALTLQNITDIMVNDTLKAIIILNPDVSPVWAQLFVNGIATKNIYLYNSSTELTFTNLNEGQYNITLCISQSEYYFAANVSKTFNVGRFNPKLVLYADNINLGEDLILNISSNNFQGDATLSINGVNRTISINRTATITLSNLSGGKYDISVIFNGNSIYLPSTASKIIDVIKHNPSFSVNVTQIDKNAIIKIKANSSCTGEIGIYVNFELYRQNITNGEAIFNVGLEGGTNYLFVFYNGDQNFRNATYNTTIIIDEEFLILAEDIEGIEFNNVTYEVMLVEKNRITMPNREIKVSFNNQFYNITTNNDGIASLKLNLACGSYTITSTYKNQSVTTNIKINLLDFNLNGDSMIYGEDDVEIIFEGNVSGKLDLKVENITKSINFTNSKAIINISSLNAGDYVFNVTYSNEVFSKSKSFDFKLIKANPILNITAYNIKPGEDEIIEVTCLNKETGNIVFIFNNTQYPIQITNSRVVLNLSNLEIGIYNVLINYTGDENYNPLLADVSFGVRNITPQIILDINNTNYGQDILIKAKINATGTVTFRLGDISKTVDIQNNEVNCKFGNLDAGTYIIDVEYGGNEMYTSSTTHGFFRVLKADSTIIITADEIVLGENILIYAKVSPNATGVVYFSIDGYYSPRAKQVDNGTAWWYISPLEAGKYTVIAEYRGDSNYNPSNTTFILKISQRKSILDVSVNDVSKNDRVVVNMGLKGIDGEAITGTVKFTLNNKVYSVNIRNGKGSLVIGRFDSGKYYYSAVYEGNDEFSTSSAIGEFEVVENLLKVNLTSNNVRAYYTGSQVLKILLTSNNKVISQADVNVKINGVNYIVTTDNKGKATLNLNLKPGKYVAEMTFNKTNSYEAATYNASVVILSTINSTNLVKLLGTASQYFAIFYNSDGKALGNTEVKFILNGKSYSVKTLPNGIVRLNININPGTYQITAINTKTGEQAVNTIRIYAKIMENNDLIQYYGANNVYKVRIINTTTGEAVGMGEIVKFTINKKIYTIKTDNEGYASLKITFKPKTYTITVSYEGYVVSNQIVVKPVLTAKNIVAKHVKKIKFKAKLVDSKGKALKGKKITFKFRGKTYNAKTNKKGIACISLKNLKLGKFKIKTVYDKSKITNTIKIKK